MKWFQFTKKIFNFACIYVEFLCDKQFSKYITSFLFLFKWSLSIVSQLLTNKKKSLCSLLFIVWINIQDKDINLSGNLSVSSGARYFSSSFCSSLVKCSLNSSKLRISCTKHACWSWYVTTNIRIKLYKKNDSKFKTSRIVNSEYAFCIQ